MGTDPASRVGDGPTAPRTQHGCAPPGPWRRCWEAVRAKGINGHVKTHSTTTTTASQASEGSVTVNGYGRWDVRMYGCTLPTRSRGPDSNQAIAGLARPRRARGYQGACHHAIPHPRKPQWTPMKPFLCILYAIMFLCDSFLPSFASRQAP